MEVDDLVRNSKTIRHGVIYSRYSVFIFIGIMNNWYDFKQHI